MTVSTTSSFSGPYNPNGVTTSFPFSFTVDAAGEELRVEIDGAEIDSADYTVTVNAGNTGGAVLFGEAPTGDALYVISDPAFTQEIQFENAGPYLAESHDEAMDAAARRDIALKSETDRSFRVPIGEEGAVLPSAEERASHILGFDSSGEPVMVASDATIVAEDLAAAEAAADEAALSAADAEASADAAGLSAAAAAALDQGLYADTAAGLAATASGSYFAVADNVNDVIKIYKDNAGVAEHQFDLPSEAAISELYERVDVGVHSTDLVAFVDNAGTVAMLLDSQGRLIDADGNDILGNIRSAAYAGAAASVAAAATDAKFTVDKATAAVGEARMFDRLVWANTDTANINAIRMPAGEFISPDTAHVFGLEKRGTAVLNANGENGFRAAWREVVFDFVNETINVGAVNVLVEPSDWANYHGYEGTFALNKITQGENAGVLEVFWCALTPDNVDHATPGTLMNMRYATSLDDYAAVETLAIGTAPYVQFPSVAAPTFQIGAFIIPNAAVEVPAGDANAGRRVVTWGLLDNAGDYKPFTIYADKDDLFSDAWAYGTLITTSGTTAIHTNETALVYSDGLFHLYSRVEDNNGGVPDNSLTHPGIVHNTSATGIGGWSAPEYINDIPFGNTAPAARAIPDGAGRIVVGASISPTAGLRDMFRYGLSYDGDNFVATVDPEHETATQGYGNLTTVIDPDGVLWIVHFYEQSDGTNGFNFFSHVRVRAMTVPYFIQNAEAL